METTDRLSKIGEARIVAKNLGLEKEATQLIADGVPPDEIADILIEVFPALQCRRVNGHRRIPCGNMVRHVSDDPAAVQDMMAEAIAAQVLRRK